MPKDIAFGVLTITIEEMKRGVPAMVLLGRLIALTVGLATTGWVGTSRAMASCGDYVHVGGLRTGSLASTSTAEEGADALPPDIRAPFPNPRRCSGPQCRGESPQPTPSPMTVFQVTNPHWGVLASGEAMIPVGMRTLDRSDFSGAPWGMPSTIFRPPR